MLFTEGDLSVVTTRFDLNRVGPCRVVWIGEEDTGFPAVIPLGRSVCAR